MSCSSGMAPIQNDQSLSDRETVGSPSPPPQSASITEAINDAPALEFRKLVLRLWDQVPATRPFIELTLMRPIGDTGDLKRKAFEECRNCQEYYDVDLNDMNACRYHESHKELDEDSEIWADHDPDGHGDPFRGSYAEDVDYEDGFRMACCDRKPYEPGCVVSRHKPRAST